MASTDTDQAESTEERTLRLLREEILRLEGELREGHDRERALREESGLATARFERRQDAFDREVVRLEGEVSDGLERERVLTAEAGEAASRYSQRGSLLDEVNHRAKNSIQMAISLLTLQRQASSDSTVSEALGDAIGRLAHVARIHSMLYATPPDDQKIDFGTYLETLCDEMQGASLPDNVTIEVESCDLMLDPPRATNLALIAGEAITNAAKHAFPDGRTGKISVDCRRSDENGTVSITDDGVGIRKGGAEASVGMKLIHTLSRALGGEDSITGDKGTRVTVSFPL